MSEYIKREDALHELSVAKYEVPQVTAGVLRTQIRSVVNAIPAADVEPVVRARWQDGKCTNCECFGFPKYYGGNEYTIRCPNCGAHMSVERSGSGE